MRRTKLLQEIRVMRFEEAYSGWQAGRLSQEEAARLLGVCERTLRRYINRYEESGLEGLIDRRLEQVSHRRAPVDEVMAVQDTYRRRHLGWSAKHFYAWYRREGGTRSYTWVKSRLQEAKLIAKAPGLFSSLYTDRGSHYWHTPEAGSKVERSRLTQFGRALGQLGIEMIPAYSPEARGRSERMFSTNQARLPRELALLGIADMDAANRYLREHYLPAFNAEFMQPAMEQGSAFVPYVGRELGDILCEQFERTVGKDNCVSFEGRTLQIPADRARHHYVRVKVRVLRYTDGRLALFHGPRLLARYTQDGALLTQALQVAA